MTTSRRTALKALFAAPAVGALTTTTMATTTVQAQQATPATPPTPGQTPVWPAPNTAPPSTQETPVERPRWDGPVPTEWVDPKTGHRIRRVSPDAGGGKPYFYKNMFLPKKAG